MSSAQDMRSLADPEDRRVRRTCLDQVIDVVKVLATQRRDGTFLVRDVITVMRRQGSTCSDGTVRVYVVVNLTRMDPKTNQPALLVRVSVSRYRLTVNSNATL
jgi:hypothetical protein